MTYTVNLAGFPVFILAVLLVIGGIPVEHLSRNETILAGLLLMQFGDLVAYTIETTATWAKWTVITLAPASMALIVYGFARLLLG